MAELTITAIECPKSKYSIKCPYEMTPEYITIHNTYNDASAMNEISYMLNNSKQVSFHYAVDDTRAVQGIPLNRNAWHAGDSTGNRKSIAIEICYSKSGGERFKKAEENAAILTAKLLKQYGWGIDKVKRHKDWSGKNCPHRTIELGWDRFLKMVLANMNIENSKPKQEAPSIKFKVGDKVVVNGYLYKNGNATSPSSSVTNKLTTITRVAVGAKHPYNTTGDLGWMDEKSILLVESKKPVPVTTPNKTISLKFKIGDKVIINGDLYKNANATTPTSKISKKTTVITRAVIGAKHPYNTTGDIGWMDEASISLYTSVKKSNETIAKEVIAGKWGNGADRKKKLAEAGYDYNTIQKLVNKML